MRTLPAFIVCLSLLSLSPAAEPDEPDINSGNRNASGNSDSSSSSSSSSGIAPPADLLAQHCFECHQGDHPEAGLDLSRLPWSLQSQDVLAQWVKVHDQLASGAMPPDASELTSDRRATAIGQLAAALDRADYEDVMQNGRSPIRRLNRSEYEQNLRDLLHLPHLDIKDLLPEDRESFHFNKSAESLDMTRVQLSAYLDAAGVALRQAVARGTKPRTTRHYRALATNMFPKAIDHAGRESSFFAKNSQMVPLSSSDLEKIRRENTHDPEMEVAIFRSASWPYYGYPEEFVAIEPGAYRVRFSARAVRQLREFRLVPDNAPLAMTFRARKRSLADVSGDVRAVGGLIDILPHAATYQTTVVLKQHETIEYSLMGLPVPFPITSHGGPLYYDFPPMPEGGHRGIAFRWLEIEGPIDTEATSSDLRDAREEADEQHKTQPAVWPPESHRTLFDDLPIRDSAAEEIARGRLPIEVLTEQPRIDAVRLLERFAHRAARRPVASTNLEPYRQLIFDQLDAGSPFAEAMLVGYQAFLCSGHFLYLHDPAQATPTESNPAQAGSTDSGTAIDQYQLASRLSHFLWNSRPDEQLLEAAQRGELSDTAVLRAQTQRLIASAKFGNAIDNFTDYWLDLKHIRRDAADIRLYPEYRFDDYLIESMERETKSFFSAMIRENLPVATLVDSDFVMVNDRLAKHYELPAVAGSAMRKVAVPESSPYGGLITQAAIMKVTANGTTTSPVLRGAWIMDRILGDPPPPPPDKVPAIEPDIRGATTIRQQIAKHAQAAQCAACHARFDPVGFALENFDVLGGWRSRYRSLEKGDEVTGIDRAGHAYAHRVAMAVDAHGKLPDGRTFQDIRDLKRILAAQPRKLASNLLRQWTVYATGTPLRFSERREVDAILDRCAEEGYRVQDLLRELIQSRIITGAPRSETTSEQ